MIHITTEVNGNSAKSNCKIEGAKWILGLEFESLLKALVKNNDLADVLLKAIDNVMNEGYSK